MYSNSSFGYVFVSSFRSFLSFCALEFVSFLLLNKFAFGALCDLFLTTIDSQRTRHLILILIGMHYAAASIWAITKFSNSSFGACLLDVSWRVSDLFLTFTVYWWLTSLSRFVSYLCVDSGVSLLKRFH